MRFDLLGWSLLFCVPPSSEAVREGKEEVLSYLALRALTKCICSTRLETRTKEASICASAWV